MTPLKILGKSKNFSSNKIVSTWCQLLQKKEKFNHNNHLKIRMNLAIKDFKVYEDSSLKYLGLTTHKFERYGLMDTVISKKDIKSFFENKTQ